MVSRKKALIIGAVVLSAAVGVVLIRKQPETRIFLDPKTKAAAQEMDDLSSYVAYRPNEAIVGIRRLLKNNPPMPSSEAKVIARTGWDGTGRMLQLTSVIASRRDCPYDESRYAIMIYKDARREKGLLCWVWNGNTAVVHDRGTDIAELGYGIINPDAFGLNSD